MKKEWMLNAFNAAKREMVIIEKDLLLSSFALENDTSRRVGLEMLKDFEKIGMIKIEENNIEVL